MDVYRYLAVGFLGWAPVAVGLRPALLVCLPHMPRVQFPSRWAVTRVSRPRVLVAFMGQDILVEEGREGARGNKW
jgi:hypothetical protein